ncbi:MAG: DUF1320 domain-containing protein [Nitrospirae bacterium]|nr:DUF1320 domain-containing protein [Magnetococcales bacterium]HAT50749.1 hypothetical protein [Alphaproteobacteria bacterium]
MSYTTASEMLIRFGGVEMAQVATSDEAVVIDAGLLRLTVTGGDRGSYDPALVAVADAALNRINLAIGEAESRINAYLGSRYPLPIATEVVASGCLPGICADMARYLLHDNQVIEVVTQRYAAAMRWLQDVAAGRANLGTGADQSSVPSGAGMPDFVAHGDPIDVTGF